MLSRNNSIPVHIYFQRVLLVDVQHAAKFDGQNDTPELVDSSDNTS